ncbi:MAG: TIGR00730 family Rossman fold protein [Rhodoferax sp.]|nr:TIGR00730 family Rossman fold protein [Rhodoferax sp.]
MTTPSFSLCVYCGSKPGLDPAYVKAATEVGTWIGRHGGQLVYGGGRGGLMGIVADATLQAGGKVIGIIPQALVDREWAHRDCTELHIVDTMHERKRMMAERSDAFLALPGGIGTLEELFEVWTWQQLGYHNKPIGLLNVADYYQGLLQFMDHSVAQGFLAMPQRELIAVNADPAVLLPTLVQAAGLSIDTSSAAM